MVIDVETPLSPGWWLQRCNDKLVGRQDRLRRLFSRYEGEPEVPETLHFAPETAQKFYRSSRTGFAGMIVKAPLRRLRVVSLMTSAESSDIGDGEAWRVWRRAGMLAEAIDLHRTALVSGDAYAILGVDDDGPYVTAEDPRQTVTIHDPIRQSRIRAGAKFFVDEDTSTSYAYLFMPGRVYVAKSADGVVKVDAAGKKHAAFGARTWVWDEDRGGADGAELPDGFTPIVRFRNDEGVGEFERHEDILNRLDHVILQSMVIATMQAFRQRAIKVDPADMPDYDPETGEPVDYDSILSADPGALWKLPLTAELWESGQVDMNGILSLIEKDMQRLSAVTFTPLSMFNSDAVNNSAEGASLVKEGLTDKVIAMQDRFDQPHVLVAAGLLRLAELEDRADPETIRIGWAPAVRYSLMESAQAATAGKASEVPWRTRMAKFWQFTPEEIARAESERMSDALLFPDTVAATPAAVVESDAVVGQDSGAVGVVG